MQRCTVALSGAGAGSLPHAHTTRSSLRARFPRVLEANSTTRSCKRAYLFKSRSASALYRVPGASDAGGGPGCSLVEAWAEFFRAPRSTEVRQVMQPRDPLWTQKGLQHSSRNKHGVTQAVLFVVRPINRAPVDGCSRDGAPARPLRPGWAAQAEPGAGSPPEVRTKQQQQLPSVVLHHVVDFSSFAFSPEIGSSVISSPNGPPIPHPPPSNQVYLTIATIDSPRCAKELRSTKKHRQSIDRT